MPLSASVSPPVTVSASLPPLSHSVPENVFVPLPLIVSVALPELLSTVPQPASEDAVTENPRRSSVPLTVSGGAEPSAGRSADERRARVDGNPAA